jgi:hypothetical protein
MRSSDDDYYYQAGVEFPSEDYTWSIWSSHTRLSRAAAAKEACRMARRYSCERLPIVARWRRSAGLHPGDASAIVDVTSACRRAGLRGLRQ